MPAELVRRSCLRFCPNRKSQSKRQEKKLLIKNNNKKKIIIKNPTHNCIASTKGTNKASTLSERVSLTYPYKINKIKSEIKKIKINKEKLT